MAGKRLQLPYQLEYVRQFGFLEDFDSYTSGQRLTSTLTGGGTATITADAPGGILKINAVDSTANQDNYVATTNRIFTYAVNKPLIAEARVQFTEASTNKNNSVFGFASSVTGLLAASNGGVSTNFWGAVFFKQGGVLYPNWQVCTSFGTTQTITTTTIAAADSNYTTLRVEVYPVTSSILEVSYWIDTGNGLLQALNNTAVNGMNFPIKHTGTYTTPTAMKAAIGINNGTNAAESLSVDYFGAWQLRQDANGN